jgi:O-antigen ligase
VNRKVIAFSFFYYSLILLAFVLPFNSIAIQLSIIMLSLGWLLEGNFAQKLHKLKSGSLLLFVGFIFTYIAALSFSQDIQKGIFELEKKISLLLLPLILGTSENKLTQDNTRKIYWSFVAGCLATSLYFLSNAAIQYLKTGNENAFFYFDLTSPFLNHAIYYSVYLSFAVLFIINELFREKTKKIYSLYLIILSLFFLTMLVLLSSRTVIFSSFVVIAILFFSNILKRRKLTKEIVFIGLLITFGILASSRLDFVKTRFSSLTNSNLTSNPDGENANGLTVRVATWKCSVQLIKENWLLGLGTGNVQDQINECNKNRNHWIGYFDYNAHNQFLQTWLTTGIPGLFFLSMLIIKLFALALRQRNKFLLSTSFIIFMVFLTESFLERQEGIVFFALFSSIFLFYPLKQDELID